MEDSQLEIYIKLYKLQAEKISLLEKERLFYKESIKNLDELIEVQNKMIDDQKQQISQFTRTHLRLVK